MSAKNILLFGPQGSGKGTQGEKLAAALQLPLIVTGNIFRENIKNETPIGVEAKTFINAGQLVPDRVTCQMISERLQRPDCANGFVLDGFPRNLVQAEALDAIVPVTHLLHIAVDDQAAIERIVGRRTCVAQGHVYHVKYNPAKVEGVCDVDGSELKQREDDTEAALAKRLEIYHQETEPLLAHYEKIGAVRTINGEQPIADVWKDIQALFA
jgi:adenylate kinase